MEAIAESRADVRSTAVIEKELDELSCNVVSNVPNPFVGNTMSARFLSLVDSESDEESNRQCQVKRKTHFQQHKQEEINDSDDVEHRVRHVDSSVRHEEDEQGYNVTDKVTDAEGISVSRSKNKQRHKSTVKKGSIRQSKEEALKQIHSETQRLLREKEISLPYHRPKQRTLQEFLSRKSISDLLPKAPTMAAKLKMSCQIVSKVLEEKEKEAELFYKSSDSEEEISQAENSQSKRKEGSRITKSEEVSEATEDIGIEETQKIKNPQGNRTKRDSVHQGCHELGVPKKLFGVDINDTKEMLTKVLSPTSDTNIDINGQEEKQQIKEQKLGTRNHSIPRKLFNTGVMEVENKSNDEESVEQQDNMPFSPVERKIVKIDMNKEDFSCQLITSNQNEIAICPEQSVHETNLGSKSVNPSELSTDIEIFETPHINGKEIHKVLHKKDADNENTLISEDNESEKGTGDCSNSCSLERNKKVDVSIWKERALNLSHTQPRLKGSPGTTIDLSVEVKPNAKGVNKLIDRFFRKHSTSNKDNSNSDHTCISIVKLPDKETSPYNLSVATVNSNPELSKPGAKLERLKKELKERMALKRDQEWKHKEQKRKEQEEDELDECDREKNVDSKERTEENEEEEEEECSESVEREDNEDNEELDYLKDSKRRTKCGFIEDEAEDDDQDDDNDDDEDDDEDDDVASEDGNDRNSEIMDNESKNECKMYFSDDDKKTNFSSLDHGQGDTESQSNFQTRRKFKRIVQVFGDESNSENANCWENEMDSVEKSPFSQSEADVYKVCESHNANDAWDSRNKNDTPSFNSSTESKSLHCVDKTSVHDKSILYPLSPASQLTALNTCEHSESYKKTSLIDSPDSSSVGNINRKKDVGLVKTLCHDSNKAANDQFGGLSFGKFGFSTNDDLGLGEKATLSDSQLIELCSGTFHTQPIDTEDKQSRNCFSAVIAVDRDQRSQIDDTSLSSLKSSASAKEESKTSFGDNLGMNLRIVSSDEEDVINAGIKVKRIKKRRIKKLTMSDDEDETAIANDNEAQGDSASDDEKYVDYDSEENEVVVPREHLKLYAATFLEEEAELSESDWDGSADEDEKGLNTLELEEGDIEEVDEDQIQDQLGKIHIRQMLDDDQREVRMLKEILFEDGDLHSDGPGRERKFKWKNIDKISDDYDPLRTTDDKDGLIELSEDEDELAWRKLRHDREQFLAKNIKDVDDDVERDLSNSKVFKLGMVVMGKNKIQGDQGDQGHKQNTFTEPNNAAVSRAPHIISEILNGPGAGKKARAIHKAIQKHSFLARGDAALERLAKVVKQRDPTMQPVRRRNFVFTHVDTPVKEENPEPRYSEGETGLTTKYRKRKAAAGITPQTVKRSRTNECSNKGKKLF